MSRGCYSSSSSSCCWIREEIICWALTAFKLCTVESGEVPDLDSLLTPSRVEHGARPACDSVRQWNAKAFACDFA